jgi:hypothetical protein
MKRIRQKAVILIAVAFGTVLGMFRGQEAKQKWMFKFMSKRDEKRQTAKLRNELEKGMVLLDDIEMSAFHKN